MCVGFVLFSFYLVVLINKSTIYKRKKKRGGNWIGFDICIGASYQNLSHSGFCKF